MTTDITQRLAEIKERAERATEGPWRMRPKTYDDWGYIRSPDDSFVAVARAGSFQSDIELDEHRRNKTDPTQHNMEFIANARSDVPFLLAEIERLKGDEQFKMFFDWLEEECAIMPKVFANATEAVGFFNAYLQSRQEISKDE